MKQTEKQWKDNVRTAWEISPSLAIFMPKRLNTMPAAPAIEKELTRLVRSHPEAVCHIPQVDLHRHEINFSLKILNHILFYGFVRMIKETLQSFAQS